MTQDFCRTKAFESSTVEHVLENITEFDIAYFVCHGSVDPKDPSNSHLLLQTRGPLGLGGGQIDRVSDFKKETI